MSYVASTVTTACDAPRMGALLARWWNWRRSFTVERSYARQAGHSHEPVDQLEELLMRAIETEACALPFDVQRSLDQLARDEALGVDNGGNDESKARAAAQLLMRLQRAGLL